MIKINNTYILTPKDFNDAFDIAAMTGAARKIALDRDIFPSSVRGVQKALLELTDGCSPRIEDGQLIAAKRSVRLRMADGLTDGPIETPAAIRMLLYELAGRPYSTAGAGVREYLSPESDLKPVITFDNGQSLTLPRLSAGAPSAPLSAITLLNTSDTAEAALLTPEGTEAVIPPRTAIVALTCGGSLATVIPGIIPIDEAGRISLPDHPDGLEPGRLTQLCPDPEGGFTALTDGEPVSYSVCVTPSDIEDLHHDAAVHGPIVEIATAGSHIVALTASGHTLSNIPCPQSGLDGIISVYTDSRYTIHTATSTSPSTSSQTI